MAIVDEVWAGIGGDPALLGRLATRPVPTGALPSGLPVEPFGAACFAAVGLAVAELTGGTRVRVDAAGVADALRSEASVRIADEVPEILWDPLSRIYRARDGWVRLHANYAQHREAAAAVFGTTDPEAVAAAIATVAAADVEERLHAAGGVAAAARSQEDWAAHPHGAVVGGRPLVATTVRADVAPRPWRPVAEVPGSDADGLGPRGGGLRAGSPGRGRAKGLGALAALAPGVADDRPLRGLRVLELTRVIAGPVAGRTLSWFGADVLRIESPDHRELRTLIVDGGPGKRSTRIDLRSRRGRGDFEELLAGCDVFLHGLRPGALGALGFDAGVRAGLAPGLVDAAISAYGPGGPSSDRRGFDSLVQLSSGLGPAQAEAAGDPDARPRPLPCQILDHGTGLLMAAAIVRAVGARSADGHRRVLVASLARTAWALAACGAAPFDGASPPPARPGTLGLDGDFGRTWHAPVPVSVDGVDAGWRAGAREPGADEPTWTPAGD